MNHVFILGSTKSKMATFRINVKVTRSNKNKNIYTTNIDEFLG